MRLDVNVDAYVPADYIPYEQAKVDVHRRIAAAREVADLVDAARGARGPLRRPCRSRCDNLIALQQARIKLGQAGARAVTFRGGRLAVTPIELDSVRAKRIRAGDPRGAVRVGQVAAVDARPRRSAQALPGGREGGRRAAGGDAARPALKRTVRCGQSLRRPCPTPHASLATIRRRMKVALGHSALGAFFVVAVGCCRLRQRRVPATRSRSWPATRSRPRRSTTGCTSRRRARRRRARATPVIVPNDPPNFSDVHRADATHGDPDTREDDRRRRCRPSASRLFTRSPAQVHATS